MRDRVVSAYRERLGGDPALLVRSPGRVNLIGDHTDYNDGFVLPAAIEHATWFAATPRADRSVHLHSLELGSAAIDLDALHPASDWSDYATGTIQALGGITQGFDVVMGTEIPVGAGLSSSAAFEMGIARIVFEIEGRPWDPVTAALAGQAAENDFVGMPCGIMDQLVVASAVAGSASLIDCRSLAVTPARVPDDVAVVILDTGTRRRLVDSAYENRREACERVAAALDVPALRDATREAVADAKIDPEDRRRAVHVVNENARVQAMAVALDEGDANTAGRLMTESHVSLRDDYEVSGPALDAMVAVAGAHAGCHGARMTGAGFAGCAVALVDRATVDDFCQAVATEYRDATGHEPALYPTQPRAGVGVV